MPLSENAQQLYTAIVGLSTAGSIEQVSNQISGSLPRAKALMEIVAEKAEEMTTEIRRFMVVTIAQLYGEPKPDPEVASEMNSLLLSIDAPDVFMAELGSAIGSRAASSPHPDLLEIITAWSGPGSSLKAFRAGCLAWANFLADVAYLPAMTQPQEEPMPEEMRQMFEAGMTSLQRGLTGSDKEFDVALIALGSLLISSLDSMNPTAPKTNEVDFTIFYTNMLQYGTRLMEHLKAKKAPLSVEISEAAAEVFRFLLLFSEDAPMGAVEMERSILNACFVPVFDAEYPNESVSAFENTLTSFCTELPKAFLQNKHLEFALDVIVEKLVAPEVSDDMVQRFESDTFQASNYAVSCRFLDTASQRLPNNHFFEAAFRRVMKLLEAKAAEVQKARAGALLLGTIAEGCSLPLRGKVDKVLPKLTKFLKSKDRGLQRASLWAIAEMAEHMKPGLQLKYGPKLLKMLIRAMEEPELLKHAFGPLSSVIEGMDFEEEEGMLGPLVEFLAKIPDSHGPDIMEHWLLCIGSFMQSIGYTKTATLFPKALDILLATINKPLDTEDTQDLEVRASAMQTLGRAVDNARPEVFIADDSAEGAKDLTVPPFTESVLANVLDVVSAALALDCSVAEVADETKRSHLLSFQCGAALALRAICEKQTVPICSAAIQAKMAKVADGLHKALSSKPETTGNSDGSFLNDVKAVFQLTMPLLVVEDASLTLTIFELYLKLVFVATLSQSPYQQDTVDLMKDMLSTYSSVPFDSVGLRRSLPVPTSPGIIVSKTRKEVLETIDKPMPVVAGMQEAQQLLNDFPHGVGPFIDADKDLPPVSHAGELAETTLFTLAEACVSTSSPYVVETALECLNKLVSVTGALLVITDRAVFVNTILAILEGVARVSGGPGLTIADLQGDSAIAEQVGSSVDVMTDGVADELGSLITTLVRVLGPAYDAIFNAIAPALERCAAEGRCRSFRSMAVVAYAEASELPYFDPRPFLFQVLPMAISGLNSKSSMLRRNSGYAVGVAVAKALQLGREELTEGKSSSGEAGIKEWDSFFGSIWDVSKVDKAGLRELLETMQVVIQCEPDEQEEKGDDDDEDDEDEEEDYGFDNAVVDNVVASILRIMSKVSPKEYKQLKPPKGLNGDIVDCLPLENDVSENETVISCLLPLLKGGHPFVKPSSTFFARGLAECAVVTEDLETMETALKGLGELVAEGVEGADEAVSIIEKEMAEFMEGGEDDDDDDEDDDDEDDQE